MTSSGLAGHSGVARQQAARRRKSLPAKGFGSRALALGPIL